MPDLAPQLPVAVPAAPAVPPLGRACPPSFRDLPPEAFDAYVDAVETARAEADPWLLPAVDQRRIAALGDAFRRPYHVLDQADLPVETEEERLTPKPLHVVLCEDLSVGLRLRYGRRPDVLACAELGLYYDSLPGLGPGRVAPDLSVVFGASPQGRTSYVFWRERKAPAFAMEVLSPSTWRRDLGRKRDIYAKLGIRDYVIFDPDDHISPRLLGLTLGDGAYRRLPVEELPDGMVGVYCRTLGLYVCHERPWPATGWHADGDPGRLRWYDPAVREYIETPAEMTKRAATEAKRAATEAERANRETERANREAERANREAERAVAAEARTAELMARLRVLAGG